MSINRTLAALALFLLASASLTGCGRAERYIAGITGGGTQTCVDGVLYLQFTSGVTVKYRPDGHVATCGSSR